MKAAKPVKPPLKCPGCAFSCTNTWNLRLHMQNANHKAPEEETSEAAGLLDIEKEQMSYNAPEDTSKIPEHVKRSIFFLLDYMHRTDREPLIGLEYVMEYRIQTKEGIKVKYICELCDLDTDLISIADHVIGYKHRKLYLAKEYPYVLKACSKSKEDRNEFLQRMAHEIELEEGLKMYKIDLVARKESQVNMASTKQSKRKSRWDGEGDYQKTMNKVLEYLDTFNIDNDDEVNIVNYLTEKLSNLLQEHEEAIFPAKVAKAKTVALSLVQKANRGIVDRVPNLAKLKLQHVSKKPRQYPFVPQKQIMQEIAGRNQNKSNDWSNSIPQSDSITEDVTFLRKLITLLSALPQDPSPTDNLQINSKLHMLKSLLLENPQTNSIFSTANTENTSMNQQTMLSSQNPSSLSNAHSIMQLVALIQNSGTIPMNINSSMQQSREFQNQEQEQIANKLLMILNQKDYANQDMAGDMDYANTSQPMYGDFGYDGATDEVYFPPDNTYLGQSDNPESMPYMESEMGNPSREQDMYESGIYYDKWGNPYYDNSQMLHEGRMYDDFVENTPYTRVSLPLSSAERGPDRFEDSDPDRRQKSEIRQYMDRQRPFDSSEMDNMDSYAPHVKRSRLGPDSLPSHPFEREQENYLAESSASHGDDRGGGLSAGILKMIRGKDLFTASAILKDF